MENEMSTLWWLSEQFLQLSCSSALRGSKGGWSMGVKLWVVGQRDYNNQLTRGSECYSAGLPVSSAPADGTITCNKIFLPFAFICLKNPPFWAYDSVRKKKILCLWSFLNATVKQWTIQKEKGCNTEPLPEIPNVY